MKALVGRRTVAARCFALLLTAIVMGCGRPSGVERLPVFGTVTDAGGDKVSGSISFVPDQGRPGPSAIASIKDGEYRFDKSNGPTAGPHRVIVTRKATKEPVVKQTGSPGGAPTGKKNASTRLPATPSTLSADVPAKGPYRLDFKLP